MIPLWVQSGLSPFITPPAEDHFLGEVSSAQLIDGTSLASTVGLTSGIAINSSAGWLKFKLRTGQTILVAKMPLRYRVSWNALNALDIVRGKTITIDNLTYKCRLLTGAEADPSLWTVGMGQADPAIAASSEWNRLIYRVSVGNPVPASSWASYSNAELGILASVGRLTLCQETLASDLTINIARANTSLTSFNYVYKADGTTSTHNHYGWRPVLELIG